MECTVDDCTDDARAHGLCSKHYTRLRRHGDTSTVLRGPLAPVAQVSEKRCSECGEIKPLEAFGPDGRNRDGRKGRCHPCERSHQYLWRRANPERWQEIQQEHNARRKPDRWKARLKTEYNISFFEYERMLAAQGGKCAVCRGDRRGAGKRFHVDHDHACCARVGSCGGCIRGLLCGNCNTLIGLAMDDPARLMAAAQYLQTTAANVARMATIRMSDGEP